MELEGHFEGVLPLDESRKPTEEKEKSPKFLGSFSIPNFDLSYLLKPHDDWPKFML